MISEEQTQKYTKKLEPFGVQITSKENLFQWSSIGDYLNTGNVPKLTSINVQFDRTHGLEAIQLVLDNEVQSPVFGITGVNKNALETHSLENEEQQITSVQVRVDEERIHQILLTNDDQELLDTGCTEL